MHRARAFAVEADVLLKLLAKEDSRLADGWLSAIDVAGIKTDAAACLPVQCHAASTRRVDRRRPRVLNLDETITKE